MRELSLFTGAGGGLLGTKLLGWEHIGYVEWNEYCQKVIAARIRDGYLPVAPIFTDVREFVQSGAAEQYRGFADVVSAGFPCQPFSVAGKQAGADDERNMWPATADVIRIVQPRSVLLENVPGLISSGYFGTVIGDLADMGYVGRWGVVSAADCGASHKRARVWIVAHANNASRGDVSGIERTGPEQHVPGFSGASLEHSNSKGLEGANHNEESPARIPGLSGQRGEDVADASGVRQSGSGELVEPVSATQAGDRETGVAKSVGKFGVWPAEPAVGRVANGVANRVDRLKALGNGQVSAVVRRAWECLA